MVFRNLRSPVSKSNKSVLLLGPRQVGKSTFISSLNPELELNLADQHTLLKFASNPKSLENELAKTHAKTIFIDEIQKLPSLLNTIQVLIDKNKSLRFFLTGSSARKLRRGRANLLPGRVLNFYMGPLVTSELDYRANTQALLRFGSLPEVVLLKDDKLKRQLLRSYTGTYLKEEIQAEALVRSFETFSRFMLFSIQDAGIFLDYSKLAKRARISRHACRRFFEIFEDTLVGQRIFPFAPCVDSADLIKHPKFYFFDNGVYNSMLGNFTPSPDRLGRLAEQLIHAQLLHSAWSLDKEIEISTFRTRGGFEIDFIVKLDDEVFAVEIKTSDNLHGDDVSSLRSFKKYFPSPHRKILLHMGKEEHKLDGVWCLPWQNGLKEMGL